MSVPKPILVVGDLAAGLALSDLSGHPRRGTSIQIGDCRFGVAGSGARTAGALARLGRRVSLRGRVGADAMGDLVVAALRARGVDVSGIRRAAGASTGVSLALSDGGEPSTMRYPGATAGTMPSDLGTSPLSRFGHLHVASPFLQPAVRDRFPKLLREAKKAGLTTSLDAGWDPAGRWDLEPFYGALDLLFIDRRVAKTITKTSQCRVAAKALASRVVIAVLRRDVKGAMASTEGSQWSAPAYDGQGIDGGGSGDALAAGFLDGWLEGHRIVEVLPYAAACAAATSSRPGGFEGQATRAEAFKILKDHHRGTYK